jgi:hypothetical protein
VTVSSISKIIIIIIINLSVRSSTITTAFSILKVIANGIRVKYPILHSQETVTTVASKVTESVTAARQLMHRKPSGLRNSMSVKTLKESSPRIINPDGTGQCHLIL